VDSRERTFLCLGHQKPDRVPVDCWLSAGMKIKLEKALNLSAGEFLDRQDVDLRYIEGPVYIGPRLKDETNGLEMDIWGVPRRRVRVLLNDGRGESAEDYKEVAFSPLGQARTVEEILEYKSWPSADWFDYSVVEGQCRKIRDAGRVAVFMGDRLNRLAQLKPALYLRGFEQVFVDMVENPDIPRALFAKISGFYLEYGRRILEAAKGEIDILCTGDDFGGQNAPLISLGMWKALLQEGFEGYVKLGKAFGARVMHHTCGSVLPLIPAMIDSGLDILQGLQAEAAGMDPGRIKREFGDRLSFQGGISIQKVLPRGSIFEVQEHVRTLLQSMAPGGGYIACTSHNIQADTPVCNLEAMFASIREYGVYG
jgi:uroporphyrinogen decarboxylase